MELGGGEDVSVICLRLRAFDTSHREKKEVAARFGGSSVVPLPVTRNLLRASL